MNIRLTSFVLVALISVVAIAEIPILNKYSDAELWDAADLIALVRIESGAYDEDVGFDMKAKPIVVLKGNAGASISISASYMAPVAPSRLSSSYLVFLTESSSGQYGLINEIRSAVEILYAELDADTDNRIDALRKSDKQPDWYSYDRSLWVVACNPTYLHSDSWYCMRERAVVEYTMNRIGGVKGK